MLFEHYWLAGIISATSFIVALICVLIEIYRFKQKKDNSFWKGMLSVGLIYIFFNAGVHWADQAQRGSFVYSKEDYQSKGLMSVAFLREATGIESTGCIINETIESKRCLFLLNAENTKEYASMVYVTDNNNTRVRAGKWPFAKTVAFEAIDAFETIE